MNGVELFIKKQEYTLRNGKVATRYCLTRFKDGIRISDLGIFNRKKDAHEYAIKHAKVNGLIYRAGQK